MNSKPHRLSFGRTLASIGLSLVWFAQILPLAAFMAPMEWHLEVLQDTSNARWHSLRVQTVPGVVYHLQKSTALAANDWTTISSTSGTGAEWICPVFPANETLQAAPAGSPVLPGAPTTPIRLAWLIIEKTSAGGTLISWTSLDDHTSRREILQGVTLDPIWDEFDTLYFKRHGDFDFALSPRLAAPVTFTAGTTALGPLDTAMVGALTAALPVISENIRNNVANDAQFSPQSDNTASKGFYRFAADWSVDSDGDGRFDWEEQILDGNNPFSSDSDGDGMPDQALGQGQAGSLPSPTDAEGPTPVAEIQSQSIYMQREGTSDWGAIEWNQNEFQVSDEEWGRLALASTFQSFKQALDSLQNVWGEWEYGLSSYALNHLQWGDFDEFEYERCRLRIKLDAPAPSGGYRISVRFANIRQTLDPDTRHVTAIVPAAGESLFTDVILECPEGASEGDPVEFPGTLIPAANERVTFIGGFITTREDDVIPIIDGVVRPDLAVSGPIDGDGACVEIDHSFVVDFGNDFATRLRDYTGTPLKIRWRKRKLAANGELGAWEFMRKPGSAGEYYEGEHVSVSSSLPGIYQLQALLMLPDGSQVEFPFVRVRNDRSIKDSMNDTNALQTAGAPDFFGVTTDARALTVRDTARSWLGSTQYSYNAPMVVNPATWPNPNMEKKDKCNLFVMHVGNASGAPVPYYIRYGGIPYAPLARPDWYSNPEEHVDLDAAGWMHGGAYPIIAPGRVIAAYGTGRTNGHVGILDYDGTWISAGHNTVNKYINLQNMDAHYRPFAIRHFHP